MKSRLFLSILMLLAPVIACPAQTTGDRQHEQTGGFSFCPPAGWSPKEIQGRKYKAYLGPQTNGSSPNLTVRDLPFAGSLDDFVTGNLKELADASESGALKSYKLIGRSQLTTASEQKGVKAIVQMEMYGHLLRQTFYSFDGFGDQKLLFTYTVEAVGGEQFDKVFDESMKTLQLDAKPPQGRKTTQTRMRKRTATTTNLIYHRFDSLSERYSG